jgi:hypothetical protein
MKAKLQIICLTGDTLAKILTFLATQPIAHLSVDFEPSKPAIPKTGVPRVPKPKAPLLRDRVMQEFKAAKPARDPRRTSKVVILDALAEGPQPYTKLVQAVTASGYSAAATTWAIKELSKAGEVLQALTGDGKVYSLPLSPPPPAASPEAPRRYQRGIDVIADILADGEEHDRDELKTAFVAAGFERKSLDARLYDAVKRGIAIKVGEGRFQKLDVQPGTVISVS